MRGTGDSTRKILKCSHHIMSGENRLALFVFYNRPSLQREFRRTADCLHVLVGNYMKVGPEKMSIELGNNSMIRFRNYEYISNGKWAGLNYTMVVEDGSMGNLEFGQERGKYLEMLELLRLRVTVQGVTEETLR